MSTEITPVPSDEEAAAIVAAIEALWPRPTTGGALIYGDRAVTACASSRPGRLRWFRG